MQNVKRYFLILFIILIGIAPTACKEKKVDYANAIYIEKMEATSTEFGGQKYKVQNIFTKGSWRSLSMKNASEGVQIYFLNETSLGNSAVLLGTNKIASIVVECNQESYSFYLNGSRTSSRKCGEKIETKSYGTMNTLFFQATLKEENNFFEIESVQFFSENGQQYSVIYPEPLEGKVEATSILTPAEAYQPSYVFDGRTGFGWVEGKKDAGEGETLSILLQKELTIDGFEIYTGYQRSLSHFEKNSAPTKFAVSMDGGQPVITEVSSSMGSQRVRLPSPMKGKNLAFTIKGVRKGSMWQDTVISELTLLNGPQRYTIIDKKFEEMTRDTINKIKGTVLAQVVGNQLTWYPVELSTETFLLRPNGSFVMFIESSDGEGTKKERILDGNWLIKSSGAENAVIEIFGRDKQIEEFTSYDGDPYSDDWGKTEKTSQEVIFSEKNLSLDLIYAEDTKAPRVEIKSGRINLVSPL